MKSGRQAASRFPTRWILFALVAVASARVGAEDWPQFRGPTGQGHSAEHGLPFEWSETRNIIWKTPVAGSGWSSPVIAAGRVWLTTAVKQNGLSLRAVAFDVETGREIVNTEIFRLPNSNLLNPKNSFASPTPIVEHDRVYVHFGADGTAALTTSGAVVWKTRLPYESQHGNGGSPTLYGDELIVNCDGGDTAFVVALDAQTGKVRWKTPRRQPFDQAYTTPLAIRVAEKDQIVSVGAYRAAAYDPQSGRELWRVSYADGFSNVPRPVYGHGLVYVATGFQQPTLIAVRPDGSGDVTQTHVAWRSTKGVAYVPSPVYHEGHLYVVADNGTVTCFEGNTGKQVWQERLGGEFTASPVLVGGLIYVTNEAGKTFVIKAGPQFELVSINELGEIVLSTPAISDRVLYVRTPRSVVAIDSSSVSPLFE
jgi:outer membrane protein assembly factor BamB